MARSFKFKNGLFLDASAIHGIKGVLTSGDLNDFYGDDYAGMYYLGATYSAFSNCPTGYAMFLVCTYYGASFQVVIKRSGIYYRDRSGSPASWSPWYRIVGNDLTNYAYSTPKYYQFTVPHNSSKTLKFSGSGNGEIVFTSAYTDLRGALVYHAQGDGFVRTTWTAQPSGISLSTSEDGLEITNNSANTGVSSTVTVMIFNGEIESIT